ncbi:nicotinate-nucleotide--dimethylbenzimidazole phosphoribosyltransferase [Chitinophaga pinensis]|uniref:Nicotinate-nucleotide--dimethylbenzimidazole phosphoribosyltransferase n=1 Tax=Chitinophaga pinensis (strain ATCC 43595 / DSM 2588 / LMG 13176 / NBRC 15968 / NCIMB 11800 / UQM 2034) TaxID=485918 RepID=A0A979GWR4_CHIPD|nr:nicotinate-nucleotide--dimethylbenzimidazole phosphoribosyltransferase [Chitinophaga pinensis]ACU61926.1 nicotinate-nucleotide/dimethylbenzimidazolephosp horibosyltransferase [Chitinophaga pinensis DSM 2588]
MTTFHIAPLNNDITAALQHKIDSKTKPIGSLGQLEKLALQIGRIQQTQTPALNKPTIVVFAGDHGVAHEGVSPFPQEVTYQMVFNFLQGGAAINVFTKQNGIAIKVVDAGVNFDFNQHPGLVHAKVALGTKSFLHEAAMTPAQCETAIERGAAVVKELHEQGCNVIGFGEMGIANTSAAAVIMSLLCDIPLEQCIGRGTGLDDEGLIRKKVILAESMIRHNKIEKTPLNVLSTFGGFEIAMMCGAMLQAAAAGMLILVDGFITTSALLVAAKINEQILDYCLFTHQSNEQGHSLMLAHLKAVPLLSLGMRLGEGTGAAVAYPVIQAAVSFLNEMASFESAGVSNKA